MEIPKNLDTLSPDFVFLVINSGADRKNNRIVGPFAACTARDTIVFDLRTTAVGCPVGFYFYDKDKKLIGQKFYRPAGSDECEYICDISDLKFKKHSAADIAYFRLFLHAPKGKAAVYDRLGVKVGKDINVPE